MFKFFSEKFENLKNALKNTTEVFTSGVLENIEKEEEFSEFILDDMEDTLISSDLGVTYSAELIDKLRSQNNIKPSQIKEFLRKEFIQTLTSAGNTELNYQPKEW